MYSCTKDILMGSKYFRRKIGEALTVLTHQEFQPDYTYNIHFSRSTKEIVNNLIWACSSSVAIFFTNKCTWH